jgi:hypothetical protein
MLVALAGSGIVALTKIKTISSIFRVAKTELLKI